MGTLRTRDAQWLNSLPMILRRKKEPSDEIQGWRRPHMDTVWKGGISLSLWDIEESQKRKGAVSHQGVEQVSGKICCLLVERVNH